VTSPSPPSCAPPLPYEAKGAHRTGAGWRSRNFNDAGIVSEGERPLFTLAGFTEHMPLAMADGLPRRAAALGLIARLARACHDALSGAAGR
jgi:beta-lactamase class A